MANSKHLAELEGGVQKWNRWRQDNPEVVPDLSGIDLRKADLRKADLNGANLIDGNLAQVKLGRANLRAALLQRVDFHGSDLSGADFEGADLLFANCRAATLRDANLTRANLEGANLTYTNLDGAAFTEATLLVTILADTVLSETKGLESCRHRGPSSVGIDTIFKSGGKIPESFLRGCGVPELFIIYARSLVERPIEFYSCFISYSSHDQAFVERLHADLRAKSLRCWFASEDLKIGDRFQEHIQESIRVFDKVMIVLSEASVQSRWVEREVNAAREREEREGRVVLFPIRIDDAAMNAMQPWAADIRRTRHIGDFRNWDVHSSYLKAFERLLRDLKAKDRVSEQLA